MIGTEKYGESKIETWSELHEAEFSACETILRNGSVTHAVCEVRERKRNSTLGLLPTVSELAEIINQPEIKTEIEIPSDNDFENLFKILDQEQTQSHN